ncbi:MAG: DUF4389 domain-containing protein [Candidatus Diapherotrites archaeon]|nr:DUF4389 domain-containing protein [Candidatus Diapherotrites archaeon]
MKTLKLSIPFEERMPPLEAVLRLLLNPACGQFSGALFSIAFFVGIAQSLHILFTGAREKTMFKAAQMASETSFRVLSYAFFLSENDFSDADASLEFVRSASRNELVVRLFYSLAMLIVLFAFGFVWTFGLLFQFLAVLFTGQKVKALHELGESFAKYNARFAAYAFAGTDERPPIIPQKLGD